jgi:Domain of unknown function (DUF4807)
MSSSSFVQLFSLLVDHSLVYTRTMKLEVRLIDSVSLSIWNNEVSHPYNTESVSSIDSVEDPDVSSRLCDSVPNVLYVHKSRVLWLGLAPLLFESPISVHAVHCIVDQCFPIGLRCIPKNERWCSEKQQVKRKVEALAPNRIVSWTRNRRYRFYKRLQLWPKSASLKALSQNDSSMVVLWIYPPQTTNLEYAWTRRLLRWERMYIQAQSISGYIATLGGGFFLCHHFKTAILLAQYQQQLAVLLNDVVMYFTCFVHMAYSYIYNGNFRVARSILRQVLNELMASKMVLKVEVVVRMCHSALLFCRRMRRASRSIQSSSTLTTLVELDSNRQRQIVPMDNLRRIRVVTDKSKRDDLAIPFSKTFHKG